MRHQHLITKLIRALNSELLSSICTRHNCNVPGRVDRPSVLMQEMSQVKSEVLLETSGQKLQYTATQLKPCVLKMPKL